MGFGSANEVTDSNRKFFTGVENFKVVAVNPTKEELEKLFGREISYEPEYISTQTVSDSDGEREAPQVRIDFFLNNEDPDNPIATKASFYVIDTHHKSQTGKFRVINDFGKTTWLTKEDIQGKTVPSNMSWYQTSGMKVAKRGEEELIDFIANLLNLPFKLDGLADVSSAHAKFEKERWEAIFKGDYSYIKEVIESTNNKVGVALGVKIADDKVMRQVIFNKKTLRQYTLSSNKADKFKWLGTAIDESKANGAYGTTNFGPGDYALREFQVVPSELTTDNLPPKEDVFATEPAGVEDDDNWLED